MEEDDQLPELALDSDDKEKGDQESTNVSQSKFKAGPGLHAVKKKKKKKK